jgi:uncharacterized protein with GYD domain
MSIADVPQRLDAFVTRNGLEVEGIHVVEVPLEVGQHDKVVVLVEDFLCLCLIGDNIIDPL